MQSPPKNHDFSMKVLVCSNAFKDFASSLEIGELIKMGILNSHPLWEVDVISIADGGAGTVESLTLAFQGKYCAISSFTPTNIPINTRCGYSHLHRTAFLDVIDTAGAGQVSTNDWNTIYLSSFGVGVAIHKLAQLDVNNVIIGLGGSIVSDGGIGMAQALGVNFYDANGLLIQPSNGKYMTCQDLNRVYRLDMSDVPEFVHRVRYTILSDVDITLLGPSGQAYTFARQKKANELEVEFIETALTNWNHVLERTFNDNFDIPLAGAAGGLGAGLKAILKGELIQGIEFILDKIGFDELCRNYDLIITGEGCLDQTTNLKKACYGIAKHCQTMNKPYYGIFGQIKTNSQEFHNRSIDASVVSLENTTRELRLFSKEAIVDAGRILCERLENSR